MKKNFVKVAFVAVFAAIAGYGVYTNQKADAMSDLLLANVEALANDEGYGDCNGCVYTSLRICRTYGDWGACLGEWDGYTYGC